MVKERVINKQIVKAVVICGASDCLDNFLFILAYDYSFKAGINFSVIVSMFSLLPIVISIAFYYEFGERIKRNQMVAMFVGMLSVLLITFSKEDIFLGGSSADHELHPIWAVGLMITVLC